MHTNNKFIWVWTAFFLLFISFVWFFSSALTPLVAGVILAYVLLPIVDKLEQWRVNRWLASMLTLPSMLLVIVLFFALVLPPLTNQLPKILMLIPDLLERMFNTISPWLSSLGLNIDSAYEAFISFIRQNLVTHTSKIMQQVFSSLRSGSDQVLSFLSTLFLMPIVAVYLLAEWPHLMKRAHTLIPLRWNISAQAFFSDIDNALGQYLHGQLSVVAVLALYYWLALWLAGFSLALPLGLLTGSLAFIPYFGFALGLILAFFAALLQFGALHAITVIIVIYGLGQVLESFVLTPKLVGANIGLHPITVIFALLVFGQLGFIGMLLALPLSAIAYVILKRVYHWYLQSDLYQK